MADVHRSRIPFYDLQRHDRAIADELNEACRRVIASGRLILGPELEAFESEFADYCGAEHCVGVGNGLDALHITLRALGIGPGDEVIVPAQTFIATWLAVTYAGATPVPVDVDHRTANLSSALIEAAATPRTRAIIPVHLFGQPAEMEPILGVARRNGWAVIEDAAQAHGATYRGRKAGALGDAAAFSFYPSKNLGALGDGGAVVCRDEQLARRIRMLRNYGSEVKYRHELAGYNTRLDELHAASLRVKLCRLDTWNIRRSQIAAQYSTALDQLAGKHLTLPVTISTATSSWHLYVIRSDARDELQSRLAAQGIETAIHYPIVPGEQAAYAVQATAAHAMPNALDFARRSLSLPIAPYLEEREIESVVQAVGSACTAIGSRTQSQMSAN